MADRRPAAEGAALPAGPVRQRYLAALRRRAEAVEGPARALLTQRIAALEDQAAQAPEPALGQNDPAAATASPASPLAALVARLDARHAAAAPAGAATGDAALPELRAVRQARHTWARLRVDRQLAQSLAALPDNPGPLNSQRLVLRCLQRLQALSPAYLAQLLNQLDTLAWLQQCGPSPPRETRTRR
jgi:hypothetical protein